MEQAKIEPLLSKLENYSSVTLRDSKAQKGEGDTIGRLNSFETWKFYFDPKAGMYIPKNNAFLQESEVQILFRKIYNDIGSELTEAGKQMIKQKRKKKISFCITFFAAMVFLLLKAFPSSFINYYTTLYNTVIGIGLMAFLYFLAKMFGEKEGVSHDIREKIDLKITDILISHNREYIRYHGFFWYKDSDWTTIAMEKFPYHHQEDNKYGISIDFLDENANTNTPRSIEMREINKGSSHFHFKKAP